MSELQPNYKVNSPVAPAPAATPVTDLIYLGQIDDGVAAAKKRMYLLGYWDGSEFTDTVDATMMYYIDQMDWLDERIISRARLTVSQLNSLLLEQLDKLLVIPVGTPIQAEQPAKAQYDSMFNKSGVNPKFLVPDFVRKNPQTVYGSLDNVRLVRVTSPYPLVIAWNKNQSTSRLLVNEIVATAIVDALTDFCDNTTEQEREKSGINLYGGCYNKRKVRGGSSWSSHAWGVSFDFNPEANRMGAKVTDTAFYKDHVHKQFANCLHRQGFRTLEHDLMHFQFVPSQHR